MSMENEGATRSSRIVGELRLRIEAGALAPGDRVPSTREITREWGVAMATATKVLTELRREGLVRAVPGVGTVVATPALQAAPAAVTPAPAPGGAPPPTRRSAPDQALTLDRIVAAAIAVADAEGMDAVSMRRVATDLGVATMSLYRHVADKDDLLMRMMEAAFAPWSFPADPPEGWRERLTLAAGMLWDVYRGHPWLASAMSLTRPQVVASAMPFTEWVLAALDGRGLDFGTVFTTHLTLFNYIRGTAVNVELEAEAEAVSGLDNDSYMDTQEQAMNEILATGRFPTLARLAATGYDFDLDYLFEFGLQRLLDGIAVLLDSAR
ncbi:TetR/AcrR family transcriptional regulator C-terminal domain-containing protein [Streptacidiphilus sp. N1-12]|uniref:TetR/AcrR family transcriptional regulator C-terminal domain-containing protein n=2 Tax=Streptacidiphilus alkalitolerans TaxID=3342712 RepID=A0ABV6WMS1_9ACTN